MYNTTSGQHRGADDNLKFGDSLLSQFPQLDQCSSNQNQSGQPYQQADSTPMAMRQPVGFPMTYTGGKIGGDGAAAQYVKIPQHGEKYGGGFDPEKVHPGFLKYLQKKCGGGMVPKPLFDDFNQLCMDVAECGETYGGGILSNIFGGIKSGIGALLKGISGSSGGDGNASQQMLSMMMAKMMENQKMQGIMQKAQQYIPANMIPPAMMPGGAPAATAMPSTSADPMQMGIGGNINPYLAAAAAQQQQQQQYTGGAVVNPFATQYAVPHDAESLNRAMVSYQGF